MKRIIKLALSLGLIVGLFTSCKEDITSYSYVTKNSIGDTGNLTLLINNEIKEYNSMHGTALTKESTLEDFNNLVKTIENEVETNNSNYKIYGNTSTTLSLEWYNEIIKETKLNLVQNTKKAITLSANIDQKNIDGDSVAFTKVYSEKLTAAGFTQSGNKYTFYKEYSTMEDAKAGLNSLKDNGILNFKKATAYFVKLSEKEFSYTGQISIEYELEDGNEAPKGSSTKENPKNKDYNYTRLTRDNYETCDGTINVKILSLNNTNPTEE